MFLSPHHCPLALRTHACNCKCSMKWAVSFGVSTVTVLSYHTYLCGSSCKYCPSTEFISITWADRMFNLCGTSPNQLCNLLKRWPLRIKGSTFVLYFSKMLLSLIYNIISWPYCKRSWLIYSRNKNKLHLASADGVIYDNISEILEF